MNDAVDVDSGNNPNDVNNDGITDAAHSTYTESEQEGDLRNEVSKDQKRQDQRANPAKGGLDKFLKSFAPPKPKKSQSNIDLGYYYEQYFRKNVLANQAIAAMFMGSELAEGFFHFFAAASHGYTNNEWVVKKPESGLMKGLDDLAKVLSGAAVGAALAGGAGKTGDDAAPATPVNPGPSPTDDPRPGITGSVKAWMEGKTAAEMSKLLRAIFPELREAKASSAGDDVDLFLNTPIQRQAQQASLIETLVSDETKRNAFERLYKAEIIETKVLGELYPDKTPQERADKLYDLLFGQHAQDVGLRTGANKLVTLASGVTISGLVHQDGAPLQVKKLAADGSESTEDFITFAAQNTEFSTLLERTRQVAIQQAQQTRAEQLRPKIKSMLDQVGMDDATLYSLLFAMEQRPSIDAVETAKVLDSWDDGTLQKVPYDGQLSVDVLKQLPLHMLKGLDIYLQQIQEGFEYRVERDIDVVRAVSDQLHKETTTYHDPKNDNPLTEDYSLSLLAVMDKNNMLMQRINKDLQRIYPEVAEVNFDHSNYETTVKIKGADGQETQKSLTDFIQEKGGVESAAYTMQNAYVNSATQNNRAITMLKDILPQLQDVFVDEKDKQLYAKINLNVGNTGSNDDSQNDVHTVKVEQLFGEQAPDAVKQWLEEVAKLDAQAVQMFRSMDKATKVEKNSQKLIKQLETQDYRSDMLTLMMQTQQLTEAVKNFDDQTKGQDPSKDTLTQRSGRNASLRVRNSESRRKKNEKAKTVAASDDVKTINSKTQAIFSDPSALKAMLDKVYEKDKDITFSIKNGRVEAKVRDFEKTMVIGSPESALLAKQLVMAQRLDELFQKAKAGGAGSEDAAAQAKALQTEMDGMKMNASQLLALQVVNQTQNLESLQNKLKIIDYINDMNKVQKEVEEMQKQRKSPITKPPVAMAGSQNMPKNLANVVVSPALKDIGNKLRVLTQLAGQMGNSVNPGRGNKAKKGGIGLDNPNNKDKKGPPGV